MSEPKVPTPADTGKGGTEGKSQTSADVSAYRWVIAFAVLALILFFISKWRVGYTLLYYGAALLLFFILVTQYQSITTLLAPFNQLSGGSQNG